jgi:type VI protein secretion system component Hcp
MTLPARPFEPQPPKRTERAGSHRSRRGPATGVSGVLALQRLAGNRAVTALVARDPSPNAPPAKPPAAPKVSHVIVPDVGTIPMTSWSWSTPGGGAGGTGPGKVQMQDLTIGSEVGKHSPALAQATAAGTPLGTVELVLMKDGKVYLRVKVINALVSSYRVSDHAGGKALETWTINGEKIEWEYAEEPNAAD